MLFITTVCPFPLLLLLLFPMAEKESAGTNMNAKKRLRRSILFIVTGNSKTLLS